MLMRGFETTFTKLMRSLCKAYTKLMHTKLIQSLCEIDTYKAHTKLIRSLYKVYTRFTQSLCEAYTATVHIQGSTNFTKEISALLAQFGSQLRAGGLGGLPAPRPPALYWGAPSRPLVGALTALGPGRAGIGPSEATPRTGKPRWGDSFGHPQDARVEASRFYQRAPGSNPTH
jgi:hypothetical protein